MPESCLLEAWNIERAGLVTFLSLASIHAIESRIFPRKQYSIAHKVKKVRILSPKEVDNLMHI